MAREDYRLVPAARRLWLYLLGSLVLAFLLLPILIVIPMSFSSSRFLDFPPPSLSLQWYEALLASPTWMGGVRASLTAAVLTTLLATPVGVAAAYGLHASGARWAGRLQLALLLPLMVPNMILAVGIFFVFVQADIVGSMLGLVLAHSLLAMPFVMITTLAGLRQFDMDQEKVARSLGYPRFQAFLKVTLPQIRPSVLAGALFAFVTSLDEVIVSIFIARGENTVLTKYMFTALRDEIDPTIASISSLLIAVSLTVGFVIVMAGRGRR